MLLIGRYSKSEIVWLIDIIDPLPSVSHYNSISDIQIYEKTYFRSSHRQRYQDLIEPLAKLYSHIIGYQALVICHLSRAQLSRA
jgi:hypothetical protein